MVQGSAQIRRQGAQDFMAYYNFSCARQESVPLPSVKMNVDKGMLDFNGDRLKLADWPPVLTSIAINKHLHRIAITSTFQACPGDAERRYYKAGFRKKIPVVRSKDMTFKLCKALRECLTVSPNLKTLQLNGLPLRERDLIVLTKGLAKNASLQNLSLVNCPISDEGLEVICQSVKYSPSIRTVDFTGCNLTWRGAEHMANIIKHQGMQRHGTAWAESLRYRHPHFEAMGGLRRVTLNSNTLIGDCGAAALAQELTEDLWVKAVDLQRCGLSNEGARRLLEALKTNSALCVLDVRGNPLVDKALIKTIIEKALMNSEADGQSLEYAWIKPAATEPQRASGAKKPSKPRPIRGKTTFRIAACKSTSGGRNSGVAPVQKLGSRSGYIPWRSAARAGRQRGLPPGVTVTDQIFEGAATVTVNVDSGSEEEEEEEEVTVEVEQRLSSLNLQDRVTGRQLDHFQMELRECRLRLAEERRARLKAESRVMEYELENARLRDANRTLTESLAATGSGLAPPGVVSVLEDEAVLESIESSFNKFHAFLDLLKDAGLGQLASMAGIHKSDFQPLGKPQLSSTVGKHLDVEDFPTNPDALPLVTTAAPARPGGPGETTTLRSLSSVREPLLEDRLLDVTFKKASGLAVERGIGGEKEPNQYSKPYTEHESGSEYSSYSQRSLDKVSFGGTFQIQQNKHRSGSNSHWSDPHHRSYSSHSHGSNAGLSGRSSISDTISDEMESVGSDESRNSRKGKRGAKVLSGSEGRAYPAREVMEQMRSWGDPGWRDPGWQESF